MLLIIVFLLAECRQHRMNGNADISQPMIGGDRKDQYEAVTPSECSDGGKVRPKKLINLLPNSITLNITIGCKFQKTEILGNCY